MSDIMQAIVENVESDIANSADEAFDSFASGVRRLIRNIDQGRPSAEGNAAYEAMMHAVALYRPIIAAKVRSAVIARASNALLGA